jgi:D-3-phosphoglycerate dehydrogenase
MNRTSDTAAFTSRAASHPQEEQPFVKADRKPYRVVVTPPMLAYMPQCFLPLSERGMEVVFNRGTYPRGPEELRVLIRGAHAVILGLDHLSEHVIRSCPELRIVARNGVGMDNVELDAATRYGILVTAPLGANSTSVAELTLGLLISLVRNVIPTHNLLQQGTWQRTTGTELAGKTLGIIGLGRIGKKVATRAQALEMRVIATDIAPDAHFAQEHSVDLISLPELLSQADVVSLHVPLTARTHHMINRESLAHLKRGCYLVNTARGPILDPAAVASALDNGILAGAALDVHTTEGRADEVMLNRPNVITTTHLGAYTRDSLEKTTAAAVQSIIDIQAGTNPPSIMNPEAWHHAASKLSGRPH